MSFARVVTTPHTARSRTHLATRCVGFYLYIKKIATRRAWCAKGGFSIAVFLVEVAELRDGQRRRSRAVWKQASPANVVHDDDLHDDERHEGDDGRERPLFHREVLQRRGSEVHEPRDQRFVVRVFANGRDRGPCADHSAELRERDDRVLLAHGQHADEADRGEHPAPVFEFLRRHALEMFPDRDAQHVAAEERTRELSEIPHFCVRISDHPNERQCIEHEPDDPRHDAWTQRILWCVDQAPQALEIDHLGYEEHESGGDRRKGLQHGSPPVSGWLLRRFISK